MKKFMFTAIALVAFSGVSMANTIELERETIPYKINTENIEEKNDLLPVTPLQCTAVKFEAYNQYIAGNYSPDLAETMSFITYLNCMKDVFQVIPE
jgi:hypothetical protein